MRHWILLFALLGASSLKCQTKDSLTCLTPTEMRKVAVTILKSQENARLLDNTQKLLNLKMEIIADSDEQLKILNKTITNLDAIISNKEAQLAETTKLLKKEERRKKFWKWFSSSTAVVTGVIIVVLAVK
jgi:hypothetical protein